MSNGSHEDQPPARRRSLERLIGAPSRAVPRRTRAGRVAVARVAALAALLVPGAWALALAPAAQARTAVPYDASPGTVTLDQPSYTAHEDQGTLTITILRTGDLSQAEHVGYGVKQQDARNGIDFYAVSNHYITMAPGQSSYSFQVQIIDNGMNAPPVHALAYLYGSWPDSLGPNSNSLVTILRDDPLQARDAQDPLGVPPNATGNPIAGARFFVDPNSPAAQAQRDYAGSNPAWARLLGVIASEPGAHRFYMWNMGPNVAGQVAHYLQNTQIEQPGTTVMLSTYSLVHDRCGYTATPAMERRYERFISQVAQGIGNFHVVFFLELDSLITAPCLSHRQLKIRDAELRYAVGALEADPHVLVYLDGGAADAAPARRQAAFLLGAGVRQAAGFFLNSTHFDWTTREIHYGQEISSLLGGGVHFIVNTGENGRGPLRPRNVVRQGNEVLCNPPGRGLGPLSMSGAVAQQTQWAGLDGLLWFTNPGGSGGQCVAGAPPTGVFWPAYAVMLARNWVDHVNGPRYALARSALAGGRRGS
ncbi:MAG TPA: glycoside hydrolase family 6 protein [Solirubrobacteraceae bacterium]|nr:glycoside hydrolase family 6 protein [Solirubrobacteraceae bacterium]